MIAIHRDGKVILAWVEYEHDIESGAMEQTSNLSKLPFLAGPVVIMPDVHQGYGMPIGGVIATNGVVIPNAVGVDIGCGMVAYQTSLEYISIDILKEIMGLIRKDIPVGRKWHKEPIEEAQMPPCPLGPITEVNYDKARMQMGSLGGGNHFIEIQQGDDGHIWLMIHSGSRNLGHKIGTHYNKIAKRLNAQWHTSVPPSWDLAYLPINSKEGKDYIKDMNSAVEFARLNRLCMMRMTIGRVNQITGCDTEGPILDVAHNYAAFEHHRGKNVLVHRKGAIRAREDDVCIIPGCQGGYSFIGTGIGNPKSWFSASHGAGRVMSRSKAKAELDLDEQIALMGDAIHGIRGVGDLDEAPGAYKNILNVMANQEDLVSPVVKLEGIAVVKG